MSEFVKVCKTGDIKENSMKGFTVGGEVVAVANLNGEFYAFVNNCTHEEGTLSEGQLMGGCCVECPIHGGRFDLKTGAVKALPPTVPLRIFEVKVENGDVFVRL